MLREIVKQNVIHELKVEPRVDHTRVGVAIGEGDVIALSGTVDSLREKLAAAEAARRVFGVSALANEIEVNVPGRWRDEDSSIAQHVRDRIESATSVPPGSVTVTVTDGWVTLEGKVDHYHQKKEAGYEASRLMGVTGVFNNIEILGGPQRDADVIKNEIEQAFVRKAQLDARALEVTVQGREVVLDGTVRGWAEYNEAVETAWAIPGVSVVQNHLQIVP